jgi:uncharacterized protein (DUF952 family)
MNQLYHLVPEHIYKKSINKIGNYNCKGFENANYIHTTTNLEDLTEIANTIFAAGKFHEKPSVKFLLLKIDRSKVKTKMGFVKPSFYHIYGSIPKEAYKILNVRRDKKGRFNLK